MKICIYDEIYVFNRCKLCENMYLQSNSSPNIHKRAQAIIAESGKILVCSTLMLTPAEIFF